MSNNIQNILDEELKLLIRATRNELFRFISVQYNHYDLVRKVKHDLVAQYPKRPVHYFNLDNCNIETFISDILASKSGLVFIEKFELIFTESFHSLCIGFNQRRDLFSTLPIQIIVFIPSGEDNLQHFQKMMPDVFSIVNPMIQLYQEIETMEFPIISIFDNSEYSYSGIEEAKSEIVRIKKRINELKEENGNDKIIISLKINLAMSYEYCGEYIKSKIILEELLKELEAKNKVYFELEISNIQNVLGLVLHNLGDFNNAKKLFEKEISYREKKYGTNDPYLSTTYSNLASLLRDTGNYESAKSLFEKTLALERTQWGDNHPKVAIQYSNLGLILENIGQYEEAKALLEKALNIDIKNYGENHPSTATTYSNLGLILNSLGDYLGAANFLEKAMEIKKKVLGIEHPNTSLSYSNLGTVLIKLRDYNKARNLLEKAVEIDEQVFGYTNPITGQGYFNLGLVYFELHQNLLAITFLEKAHNIYLNNFGTQHPRTQYILQNLENIKTQILSKKDI